MARIRSDDTPDKDVYITELTIHKVRHLRDIHIPLSKRVRKHLILTGKNGSGKTSVLESIKNHLLSFASKEVSIDFNSPNRLEKYYYSGRFILAFYSARRRAEMTTPEGLSKIDFRDKYGVDEQPGKEFIQYIVNLKADRSFAREEKDLETVKEIGKWFRIFEKCLKDIFEDKTLKLEFDRKNYNFRIVQEGKESFDFNTLADGYSAIMNVVTDLILRMGKHKTKSYDVQGVVLIDELEAHLHIDLQKKIFPFLTRFFPRIQFIVSTHSPFILNSIENAVIYDLEKHLLVSDLSAYPYDGIIEGYFDNDKYSQIIKDKIETYERLVNQQKRSESEEEQMIELRGYLKEVPNALAPELKARFQQIELNRIGDANR